VVAKLHNHTFNRTVCSGAFASQILRPAANHSAGKPAPFCRLTWRYVFKEALSMELDGQKQQERNLALRVAALIVWLLIFYVGTNMIVGGIVGAFAGGSTNSFGAGYSAGQQTSVEFFQKYGMFVLVAQVIVFGLLAYLGKLPGTSKYKAHT